MIANIDLTRLLSGSFFILSLSLTLQFDESWQKACGGSGAMLEQSQVRQVDAAI